MRRGMSILVAVALLCSIAGAAYAEPYDFGVIDWNKRFEQTQTVSVMGWWYSDREASTDYWTERCLERYNIKLEPVSYNTTDYSGVFATLYAADDLPDLVSLHEIKNLLAEDVSVGGDTFVDLNAANMPNATLYPESAFSHGYTNGEQYYLSVNTATSGVLYNASLFDKLNLKVPTTYDEFLAVCDACLAAGVHPLGAGWSGGDAWSAQIYSMLSGMYNIYYFGATPEEGTAQLKAFYNPEDQTSTAKWADYPELTQAIYGKAYEWLQAGYFNDDPGGTSLAAAHQMVAVGDCAMMITGTWEVGNLRSYCAEGTQIGFFPLPFNDETTDTIMYTGATEGIAVNAKADNMEAALIALNCWLSPEVQNYVIADIGGIPLCEGVVTQDPIMQEIAGYMTKEGVVAVPSSQFMPIISYGITTEFGYNNETSTAAVSLGLITPAELAQTFDKDIAQALEYYAAK